MATIPYISVQTNPLDVLLTALGYRLIYLAQQGNHDAFNRLTQGKSVTIQFASQEGVKRCFIFQDERIGQAPIMADNPDLTITFKDNTQSVKLLAKLDTAILMKAIQEGDITVTGDYKLPLWFVQLIKTAVKLPDNYKPHLNKAKKLLGKFIPR